MIQKYIKQLNLLPHPEGGFFSETYRSKQRMDAKLMHADAEGERNFSTAIYYLLGPGDCSKFHRIKQDEMWHFYDGNTAIIVYYFMNGKLKQFKLGRNVDNGEVFQAVVPAGCWFAAELENRDGFVLCGCTVAPGFDFRDFEMASSQVLLKSYPQYPKVINRLT